MPLAPQAQVGPYRIVEHIATGGMGEVYLGSHTGLNRRVAIKVIHDATLADPQAVKRFSREARLASTLDHPHICRVHDYIEHENRPLLVLEYCEGETLSERLKQGRLDVDDVIRIGTELADAVAHAHSHGVIHRDLKPSNVILGESGAKILDFGLVKRTNASGGTHNSEQTESLTDDDARLGTLPYMAPEQISAADEDERTDVYGLGVILFQMLTGRLPFVRKTNAALAASVLRDPAPPVLSVAPHAPVVLAHVIDRCLAKDPGDRYQTASALAGELKWLRSPAGRGLHPRAVGAAIRRWGGWSAAAVAVVLSGWLLARPDATEDDGAPLALTLVAPPGISFISNHQEAVISPDGASVLLSGVDEEGRPQLWWRPLQSPDVRLIPSAEGAHTPFWSNAGRRVGYFEFTSLLATDVEGGAAERIVTVSLESRGASWGEEDVILYAPDATSGIFRVTPGEAPSRVTSPDPSQGQIGHVWPSFLPDGERFLYLVTSPEDSIRGIYLASLESPVGRRVVASQSSALFANGHLLFLRDGTLLAQRLDPSTATLLGRPVPLASPVATTQTLQAMFSASTTGIITYSSADSKDITELVWHDLEGNPISRIGRPARHRNPTLSPDGRLLSVEIYDGPLGDLWWFDLETNRSSRMNDPALQPVNPVWSPDGMGLVFASPGPEGWSLYRWDRNTTSSPRSLLTSRTQMMPTDWTPDGRFVIYAERTGRGDYDLSALDVAGDSVIPLLDGDAEEFAGRISSTGDYLAYVSDRVGEFEVFVEPFPRTGRSCQISSGGGWDPVWGASDEALHYLTEEGRLMASAVDASDGCPAAAPRPVVLTGAGTPRRSRNHYAFDARQERFLINTGSDDPRARTIEVLVNWPAALTGGR